MDPNPNDPAVRQAAAELALQAAIAQDWESVRQIEEFIRSDPQAAPRRGD
jgi:hypothetical protein